MDELNGILTQNIGFVFVLLMVILAALFFIVLSLVRKNNSLREQIRDTDNEIRSVRREVPDRQEQFRHAEGISNQIRQLGEQFSNQNDSAVRHTDAKLDYALSSQENRLVRIQTQLDTKLAENDRRLADMKDILSGAILRMQNDNNAKLDEIRQTVDRNLHATLDERLTESFSLVNQRLEEVYKGLGEMRTLAGSVGDLKRVLTNVKSRGIWGEMQLGVLLSQVLSPGQYDENVEVLPSSGQRVEYAIKLPGRDDQTVYLPIDAKFPAEDYQRLLDAQDNGDTALIAQAAGKLQTALKTEARRISEKYIVPPYSTDFAVMFLPLEGLYAEALRNRGLAEEIQQQLRVVIAGPTTITALLSSLQVGFRTLAIEKRTSEVWQLLGAVKNEFAKFTQVLDEAQRQVNTVSRSLEKAAKNSKRISSRLEAVEVFDELSPAAEPVLQDRAGDDRETDGMTDN